MSDSDKNLIDILKKFPDQNPNPVIRVSGSGILNEDMELIGVLFATHPAYKNSTLTSTYASTLLFLSHAMRKIEVTK